MSYTVLRFHAGADHADAWGDALLEGGALSVDVADPTAGTADEAPIYAEPGEPKGRHWATNTMTALYMAGTDVLGALRAAATVLGLPLPAATVEELADDDWVRRTQAQFAPIRVDDGLWIVPSWCEPPDRDAINIAVDPGLAFGTGSHPTTALCLRWLARELRRGESVLDYGCGSGILAIAAARLGAGRVVGTDIDEQAIAASRANAGANAVPARFVHADALDAADSAFDVIVANILANPLRMLAPALAHRARSGGRIVLSGVLEAQVDEVRAAYARWFKMRVWAAEDGWVALAGDRLPGPTE